MTFIALYVVFKVMRAAYLKKAADTVGLKNGLQSDNNCTKTVENNGIC